MVTPVSHFRRLDPDEVGGISGSIVGGMDKGLSTMSALNQLYQQKLANQLQQGRADIQPQMLQAQLAQSQARTPEIQAQTGYMQGRTANIPIDNILKSQSLYGKAQENQRIASHFGPGFKINRILNTVQGQSLYARNKEFAKAADEVMAGQVTHTNLALIANATGQDISTPAQGQGGQQPGILPGFAKHFNVPGYQQQLQAQQQQQQQPQVQQQVSYQQPVVQGQSNNQLLDAFRRQSDAGGQQLQQQQGGQNQAPPPDPASGNQQFGVTSEDVAAGQEATKNLLESKLTTPAIRNQRVYAESAEGMFDQWQDKMPGIVKFSGLVGKSKLSADKYASAMGLENSPEYKDYIGFMQALPVIANEYRRGLGGSSTIEEQKIMRSIINPISWNTSPELALEKWNTLRRTNQSNLKAITMGQTQVKEALKKRLQGGSNLGSIQAPSFQNKQEYQSWFNSLSKEDKRAYRSQIGARR